MQIFIIGTTKSGKSTLSDFFHQRGCFIYEAGSWVRQEFHAQNPQKFDEMSNEFKNQLTLFAMQKLQQDSLYSFKKYLEATSGISAPKIIIGVRNPDDFIHMLACDTQNKVIFLQDKFQFSGELAQFEEGIDVIIKYLEWKQRIVPIPTLNLSIENFNDSSTKLSLEGLL